MNPLQAAYWYFSVVFTIGFLMKPVELLWLDSRLGEAGTRWLETAVMLVATVATARWVVLQLGKPASPGRRLCIGLLASGFIVLSEIVVAFWIRRLGVREFLVERDVMTTATCGLSLLMFTVMPLLVGRE